MSFPVVVSDRPVVQDVAPQERKQTIIVRRHSDIYFVAFLRLEHLQDHQFWIWVEVPDDHLTAGNLLLVGCFEHAIKAIRQRSHLSVVKRDPLIRVLPGELTVLT